MSIAILIPAAGSSSRMRGRDKLAELVDGEPLLTVVARRALGVSDEVIVTLPLNSQRRDLLDGLNVQIVEVPNPEAGMGTSLAAGASKVSQSARGIMILPADMPDITESDIKFIAQAFDKDEKITRGTSANNTPGHPVIFPKSDLPALRSLKGDDGARSILKGRTVVSIVLPARHALTDLDTPEDWNAWRKSSGDTST